MKSVLCQLITVCPIISTIMRATKFVRARSHRGDMPHLYGVLERKIAWSDVVHIHMVWEYPTLLAARLTKKLNKPYLLRPCGMLDAWSMSQSRLKKMVYLRMFSKSLFDFSCLLHFTTQAEREKSIVPRKLDSIVIENGISNKAFSDNSSDAFLDLFPALRAKIIVLFLGRVHPKKQPDVAIRAFAKASSEFPDAVLVLAGPCDVAYQNTLNKLANELGVGERVCFAGMLQGKVLYSAYRAATVFVLPSMQENFGIAVAEAMAAGLPVIISDNVDIKSYIEEGEAGIVCLANPKSFAVAIERVLSMPKLAIGMGENGRDIAEKYFTWSRAAEQLDQEYRKMVC